MRVIFGESKKKYPGNLIALGRLEPIEDKLYNISYLSSHL